MTPKSLKFQSGYTIVEMLAAFSILVFLVTAMGALLFSSFQVIKMLDYKKADALRDGLIALDQAAQEIQKSPVYSGMAFQGEADRLSFPVFFSNEAGFPKQVPFKLGQVQEYNLRGRGQFKKVSYYFDSAQKAWMRQVGNSDPKIFIEHVKSVSFAYAMQSSAAGEWIWKPQTPETGAAQQIGAVSIQIQLEPDYANPGAASIKKTFLLARISPLGAISFNEGIHVEK